MARSYRLYREIERVVAETIRKEIEKDGRITLDRKVELRLIRAIRQAISEHLSRRYCYMIGEWQPNKRKARETQSGRIVTNAEVIRYLSSR